MNIKRLLSVFIVLLAIRFLSGSAKWIHQTWIVRPHLIRFPEFLFIVVLILSPFIIKWYKWLIRHSIAENNREAVLLFVMGGLCWIITYWKLDDSTLDFQFHDTYYIISFVTACRFIALGFGILSIVYFVFPLIFGSSLNVNFSRIHFWTTYIGLNILVGNLSGNLAMGPRYYIEYAGWEWYNQMQILDKFIHIVLILLIVAQLLFLFNVVISLFRKSKIRMKPL